MIALDVAYFWAKSALGALPKMPYILVFSSANSSAISCKIGICALQTPQVVVKKKSAKSAVSF